MIKKIWHHVPYDLRVKIANSIFMKVIMEFYRFSKKKAVINELKEDPHNQEYIEIIEYLRNNKLAVFPYNFVKECVNQCVNTFYEDGFYYVVYVNPFNGKTHKIFAPKEWKQKKIVKYFTEIFYEQNRLSPHCYFQKTTEDTFNEKIVADLGAAEGIFSISIVDFVKKIYLFECDSIWIEPLRRTFSEYRDKIEIVQKYVGNKNENNITSIDSFFDNKDIDVIKADIEGSEIDMLEGCDLSLDKIETVLIAAYHKHEDEKRFSEIFKNKGYCVFSTDGYMIPWLLPLEFKKPYVRRGLLIARKELR